MSGTKEELTKSWLVKSNRDLLSARILTPLAVEYRYPGEYVEPEADEYKAAFEAAEYVYKFVLHKLPVIIQP